MRNDDSLTSDDDYFTCGGGCLAYDNDYSVKDGGHSNERRWLPQSAMVTTSGSDYRVRDHDHRFGDHGYSSTLRIFKFVSPSSDDVSTLHVPPSRVDASSSMSAGNCASPREG